MHDGSQYTRFQLRTLDAGGVKSLHFDPSRTSAHVIMRVRTVGKRRLTAVRVARKCVPRDPDERRQQSQRAVRPAGECARCERRRATPQHRRQLRVDRCACLAARSLSSQITFPDVDPLIEKFECRRLHSVDYPLASFGFMLQALRASIKTSIRIDDAAMLSLQFMIASRQQGGAAQPKVRSLASSGHAFVEFVVRRARGCPLTAVLPARCRLEIPRRRPTQLALPFYIYIHALLRYLTSAMSSTSSTTRAMMIHDEAGVSRTYRVRTVLPHALLQPREAVARTAKPQARVFDIRIEVAQEAGLQLELLVHLQAELVLPRDRRAQRVEVRVLAVERGLLQRKLRRRLAVVRTVHKRGSVGVRVDVIDELTTAARAREGVRLCRAVRAVCLLGPRAIRRYVAVHRRVSAVSATALRPATHCLYSSVTIA